MLISYNWLKRYIKEIPSEEDLVNLITFKICELESVEKLPSGDTVFDMKILPDRAHDLLSHEGVAKEIAGILGVKISENSLSNSFPQVLGSPRKEIGELGQTSSEKNNSSEFSEKTNNNEHFVTSPSNLQIDIQSLLCRRYIGRIVRGVEVGPSPKWMTDLLLSVGQRSINNIVDITNFILFDTGQPIHIFDLDKLESEKIIIRNAKDGEKVELLGEKVGDFIKERSFELKENNLVIADEKDILALAGVKGGKKAEVDSNTKNILIEVASFDPISIRKTAGQFRIKTDAVKRYENNLTSTICDRVMEDTTFLVKEFCPNVVVEESVDVYKTKQEKRTVKFQTSYLCKILGTEIKDEEIEKILKNYNHEFSHQSDWWDVVVPDKRLDIIGAHDMAEEIGRIYGYEKIEPKIPRLNLNQKDNEIWTKICLAKEKLANDGYKEVMTYAFTNKGDVEVMASASDKNFLRTNLLDGLVKAYEMNRLNASLLDINEIKIFEIGTIFTKKGEETRVAFCDKKKRIEMSLDEYLNNILNIQDSILDYQKNKIISNLENSKFSKFKMWSSYPFISRDVAVWVSNDFDSNIIYQILKEESGDLLIKEPYLFDKFTKEDRTSYAYRLVFQSYEKTLKDEEVEEVVQRIYKKLQDLGLEIR